MSEYIYYRSFAAPATLMNMVLLGVFIGIGSTRSAMIQLIFISLLNALLSIIFVIIFNLGIMGVALGTVIAQWSGWILSIIILRKLIVFNTFSISSYFNIFFYRIIFSEKYKDSLPIKINRILRKKGTERPFQGEYDNHFIEGEYNCAGCGTKLFESDTKYNSGCGWPAFHSEHNSASIARIEDYTHGMIRIEAVSYTHLTLPTILLV